MNMHKRTTMQPIVDIPNQNEYGEREATPVAFILYKNLGGRNRPTDSDSPRQRAKKLLENGEITVRDEKILETLLGVGLLTTDQIQRLFWPDDRIDKHQTLRRLRLLGAGSPKTRGKHILTRSTKFMPHLRSIHMMPGHVFGLSDAGQEVVAIRHGLRSRSLVPYDDEYYSLLQQNHLLKHHIQTSEIYVRLKLKARELGWGMKWINEMGVIIRDGKLEAVRPDGFAKLYDENERIGIFIETDRRGTNWRRKMEAYESAQLYGDWQRVTGLDVFPVIACVMPSQRSIARVGQLVQETNPTPTFVFKPWTDFLQSDAYEGWCDPKAGRKVCIFSPGNI
ncbi:MAG: hypothetical protein GY803_00695 [Chloroflexi bacterium]|nr:hypothetical protein [Chloroflexota bacterium]